MSGADARGRHSGDRVMQVYDVANDRMTEVTAAEAAAGMMRYARTLGPGSAACGEWERRAVELLRSEEAER